MIPDCAKMGLKMSGSCSSALFRGQICFSSKNKITRKTVLKEKNWSSYLISSHHFQGLLSSVTKSLWTQLCEIDAVVKKTGLKSKMLVKWDNSQFSKRYGTQSLGGRNPKDCVWGHWENHLPGKTIHSSKLNVN